MSFQQPNAAESAPMVRLLVCGPCGSIQELPIHDGPPEYDYTYHHRLSEHVAQRDHRDNPTSYHPHTLIDVPQNAWNNPGYRKDILEAINNHVGVGDGAGLGSKFYDVKATYQEDAMLCWQDHKKTRNNCPDYLSDSKRILPDTRGDRKDLGLDPAGRTPIHLCHFCPYQSVVMQRARKARGAYDK